MSADATPATDKTEPPAEGPGYSFVPVWGIVVVAIYLIIATAMTITAIAQMWPHPTPSNRNEREDVVSKMPDPKFLDARCGAYLPGKNASNAQVNDCRACENQAHALRIHFRTGEKENDPECIRIFTWDVVMWNERRLMLIVVLSGMLGGLLYANRSFFWYVGNRRMVRSWVPIYFFAPVTSALLGLIIYLVIRGGFFSGISTIGDTSPYAFAAVAVLVGMHHRETAQKLREIFEVVFTKAETGKNAVENPPPKLTGIKSDQTPPLSRTKPSRLTLTGEGFIDDTVVRFDGKPFTGKVVRVSATQLNVLVQPSEIPDDDNEIVVTVFNPPPGGGASEPGIPLQVEPKPTT